jgi:bifunctional lysine-specific demethylase and histidyl-hydroxylase MINA
MMFQDAQRLLAEFLAPLSLDEFLDEMLLGGYRKIDAGASSSRTGLLGADPESTLLNAWHLAPKLTFHSANASGEPPPLEGVQGASDFQKRIALFHARNYSVRFPELRPVSASLDRLARALEVLLHQPVTVSAFWSRGGMKAPVHYDDHDLLVVQLRGTKRWYVSNRPSELPNTWQSIPKSAPQLGPHDTLDMQPGDVIYLPRGTWHSVDSDSGSLHVSIGYTPLTLREALIAALDHLSDLDRGWRTSVGGRLGFQLRGSGIEPLVPLIQQASNSLMSATRTPGFLISALQWRSSRAIAAMRPLPLTSPTPAIDLDSELIHNDMAFCHLTASPERIDVSYPGGHIFVHRGAQVCIEYIVNNARFRVRDIPGEVGDDIRLSLATRFLEIGFLKLASASPAQRSQIAAA